MKNKFDLLSMEIEIDDRDWGEDWKKQKDYSIGPVNADVEIVFRNQRDRLLDFIDKHECLLGAVAWFTDHKIINALQNKMVSIVLQKEDFLRPDSSNKEDLRKAYENIPSRLRRPELPVLGHMLSVAHDETVSPFRCVGNYNSEKSPAMPRMHNKFLIGCRYVEATNNDWLGGDIIPQAVWTGSYNFSFPAQKSFENAIIIHNSQVAEAYAKEFSQIFAFSEPLDWNAEWVAPEYRIGT